MPGTDQGKTNGRTDALAYQMNPPNTNNSHRGVWEDGAVLRQLIQSRLARLFTRFAAGTVVSTACSQLTLVLLFGVLDASAAVSGAVAFVAGAIPNFLIHRFWTWRRSGPVGMRRELLPYLAVITFSGLVAVGITAGVDRLLGGAIADHALRTAIIAVVYGLSYLPVFVLKFALLDRLVFGAEYERTRWRRARNSRDQVPTITRA
jgi:putative flippase GtrA